MLCLRALEGSCNESWLTSQGVEFQAGVISRGLPSDMLGELGSLASNSCASFTAASRGIVGLPPAPLAHCPARTSRGPANTVSASHRGGFVRLRQTTNVPQFDYGDDLKPHPSRVSHRCPRGLRTPGLPALLAFPKADPRAGQYIGTSFSSSHASPLAHPQRSACRRKRIVLLPSTRVLVYHLSCNHSRTTSGFL